jgi:hypothetical protein
MEVVFSASLVFGGWTKPAQPRRGKITSPRLNAVRPPPNLFKKVLREIAIVFPSLQMMELRTLTG